MAFKVLGEANKTGSLSYEGRESVKGVLCNVIESLRLDSSAPEKRSHKSLLYIGVNDALMRKIVSVSETPQGQTKHEEEIFFKPMTGAREPIRTV